MTGARRRRLAAAVGASLALVAGVVAIAAVRSPDGTIVAAPSPTSPGPAPLPSPTATTSPTPGPSATPTPTALLTDPNAAEQAGAAAVLAAGRAAAAGPWRTLGDDAWPVEDRPVYVGTAEIADDLSSVSANLVIATRTPADTDHLTLRLLPAASALGRAAAPLVQVRRDGEVVEATLDRDGARLMVPLSSSASEGAPLLLHLTISYPLVAADDITDDGGPAGFGLLARYPDLATLGHWLPLLTFDAGPMVPWGTFGAFPVAIWSLQVTHPGTLVTGGAETDCPGGPPAGRTCTWARGIGLRDVSAVVYRSVVDPVETDRDGVRLRAWAAPGAVPPGATKQALGEAADAVDSYASRFGPLDWPDVDVAATPLGTGAAGMEFPGMVMIGSDMYDRLDGGYGEFAVVHEIAHQWFHALVGNSSLSDPVVDESLAQYLSYLYWADRYGQTAADDFADAVFRGRYQRAHADGVQDRAPAEPLADFGDMDTYNAMVYARAPLAFVDAQQQLGERTVVGFLVDVVTRWGLKAVTDDTFVAQATDANGTLGRILRRYWLDDAPLDVGRVSHRPLVGGVVPRSQIGTELLVAPPLGRERPPERAGATEQTGRDGRRRDPSRPAGCGRPCRRRRSRGEPGRRGRRGTSRRPRGSPTPRGRSTRRRRGPRTRRRCRSGSGRTASGARCRRASRAGSPRRRWSPRRHARRPRRVASPAAVT